VYVWHLVSWFTPALVAAYTADRDKRPMRAGS
jgi:hypothetical protein